MLLILSVFCVVFFWFVLGWEGVYVAHLVSFLCCVIMFFYWEVSMLLILLVFCVVYFWGVYAVHLVSFLCFFGGSMLLFLLVFCVVFLFINDLFSLLREMFRK